MVELLVGTDDRFHFCVGVDLDGVERCNIHGIGHCEGQEEFGLSQWRRLILLGKLQGYHLGEFDVDGVVIGVVLLDFQLL